MASNWFDGLFDIVESTVVDFEIWIPNGSE